MDTNQLVLENMGAAAKLAVDFPSHLPAEDRIQASFLGMTKAAQRFDPEKGYKFITYAYWYCRNELYLLHQRDLPAHLPGNAYAAGKRVAASESLDEFFEVRGAFSELDKRKGEMLVDVKPLQDTNEPWLRLLIHTALNERERWVIVLRFGLLDGEPRRLKDVAKYVGLSRERVRQIQNEAMEKLRRAA